MKLKQYQQNSVDTLDTFLDEMKRVGPKYAFMGVTDAPYNSNRFGEVSNVCVKVPTGGGKTLIACNMVESIITKALEHKMEHGIVLWFTPSEAIKTQTIQKLKDRNDWHRQVLDEAFSNNVRVFSNEEALSIRHADTEDNICIVVASLDAFRKEKTLQNKYKVYKENGALLEHFQNIPEHDYLERDTEDTIITSLANVIRLSNPLVVIDEGHKTTSKLSVDFIADLNPSFIIEFTATPREGSNILVNVHASELKREEMVKIPIVLESAPQWQNAITAGVDKRNELEKITKKNTGEYIRPITLVQAQPESKTNDNVTVKVVKETLIGLGIPEEQIAIKTADNNELAGVNLFSKKCEIRYIITVNALAEGWDCSFAYVLVSVANLGAKIAVEQIIGRIIRMPNAKKKSIPELNQSYVFASARNFKEAAGQIIGGLESNGYSSADVVSGGDTSSKYELEVNKTVKDTLSVPMLALGKNKLSFELLLGESFELAKQDGKMDFDIHYDNDGRAVIDIKEDDSWVTGSTLSLNLRYQDKSLTEAELVQWLDKKMRFSMLTRADKIAFVKKVIKGLLSKHSLSELSVNRFILLDNLARFIHERLEEHTKKVLDDAVKKKKVNLEKFEAFPDQILLSQSVGKEFNRNYYEKIDKLNKEEQGLVERLDLDTLPNIKYWVRNREKLDPFYIQGWKKNKFYPDFIAVTNKGVVCALEWKGEDRISNDDTEYKVQIGELWEKLGGGKTKFYLVHNGNIEKVLNELKTI